MSVDQHASLPVRARRASHGEPTPERRPPQPAEPAVCPDCRAVFEQGCWRWRDPLPGAAQHVCPACLRVRENRPDGCVGLSGAFFRAHRDEVMALVRHISDRARLRFPLQRIMAFDEDDDQTRIDLTSGDLARSLGRALQDAFHGELALDVRAKGQPPQALP